VCICKLKANVLGCKEGFKRGGVELEKRIDISAPLFKSTFQALCGLELSFDGGLANTVQFPKHFTKDLR